MNRVIPFFHDREGEHEGLERRLRAGAPHFAPEPPARLRARILNALHSTPQSPTLPILAPARERAGTWVAAAAALLVLCGAWWLTHRGTAPLKRSANLVTISRDLLGAGARVLDLPGQAEANLRAEARRLLADSTRVAAEVLHGLPAPLRAKFERM